MSEQYVPRGNDLVRGVFSSWMYIDGLLLAHDPVRAHHLDRQVNLPEQDQDHISTAIEARELMITGLRGVIKFGNPPKPHSRQRLRLATMREGYEQAVEPMRTIMTQAYREYTDVLSPEIADRWPMPVVDSKTLYQNLCKANYGRLTMLALMGGVPVAPDLAQFADFDTALLSRSEVVG